MDEDFQHIKAFQKGDRHSFKPLYIKYLPPLTSFLSRHLGRSNEEVLDMAQDVMMKVFQNLPGFRFKSTFTTYLFVTANNHLKNHYRKKSFQPELKELIENKNLEKSFLTSPIEDSALKYSLDTLLQDGISNLPEPDRTVIILKSMQELKFEEIAEIIQTSLRNVKFIKARAEKRLKIYLEERGISLKDGL